ncbi:filamentous hemagglutinin N-terminal domain-containing protein, partial [Burkholderia ambifaria]|uniref:two-partner secretion domain-containing protein n=1 Tax=Burkholderia ambifaria TaxID=152480 RepID=UPI0012FD834F
VGALKANGRIFIVNPNGVVFGQGAQVDVGGLVASSLGINSNDFMAGKWSFAAGSTQPGLVQVGPGAEITAKSFVALLGNSVSNAGTITAGMDPNADSRGISLVAADAATIQVGSWNVVIDKPAMNALAENSGSLVIGESKSDGSIQLNAAGRNALMGVLLTSAGTITNQSEGKNSSTSLISSAGVSVGGQITAAGGAVNILGRDITLSGNITAGTDGTSPPVSVTVGDRDLTNAVTQTVDSTVAANGVDAAIKIAAQNVLTLSGALLAPNGKISLEAPILDTGLLVPVADKISMLGIEVIAKLPLYTRDGLSVYLGKDGNFYAEGGILLDPVTHLYDAIDEGRNDLGEIGRPFAVKGELFDSGGPEILRLGTRQDIATYHALATNLVVKRGGLWVQIFRDGYVLIDRNGAPLASDDIVASWDASKGRVEEGSVGKYTNLPSIDPYEDGSSPNGVMVLRGGVAAPIALKWDGSEASEFAVKKTVTDIPFRLIAINADGTGTLEVDTQAAGTHTMVLTPSQLTDVRQHGLSQGAPGLLSPVGDPLFKIAGELYYLPQKPQAPIRAVLDVPSTESPANVKGTSRDVRFVRLGENDVVAIENDNKAVIDIETGRLKATGLWLGNSTQVAIAVSNNGHDLQLVDEHGRVLAVGTTVYGEPDSPERFIRGSITNPVLGAEGLLGSFRLSPESEASILTAPLGEAKAGSAILDIKTQAGQTPNGTIVLDAQGKVTGIALSAPQGDTGTTFVANLAGSHQGQAVMLDSQGRPIASLSYTNSNPVGDSHVYPIIDSGTKAFQKYVDANLNPPLLVDPTTKLVLDPVTGQPRAVAQMTFAKAVDGDAHVYEKVVGGKRVLAGVGARRRMRAMR